MLCKEKARLFDEYNKAVLMRSRLLGILNQGMPKASKPEHGQMRREADAAYIKSKEARLAYERHTTQHGCGD
jgi:hypothetical protein